MNPEEKEIRELRRLIRDLVALATTPAGWVGRNPAQMAESVADILLHTLRAQAVYVCLESFKPAEAWREPEYPGFREEVKRLCSQHGAERLQVETLHSPSWASPLRVAIHPVGISGGDGVVAAACANADFPAEAESLLLSLAANQVAIALQAARLRSEAELERRRLQELLAQAPAAIGLTSGPEHRWVYVNEHYIKVTGRNSASDFIGKTVRESLPEIDTQPFVNFMDGVLRTGKPYVGREVLAKLNRGHAGQSEDVYFDFVYQPVLNTAGTAEGILVHAVEVSDKVVARKALEEREQALRESEQRFRVITEATPVMVWMAGTDKLCTYFNKSWLDFVGRSLEQEVGNGWAENVHPDDFQRCLDIYTSSFDAREPFTMEYRLRHHSGQFRWILDNGVPRHSADGHFEGYVGGCLDVHEQKEAREKLQNALMASQRLAAIVESSDDAIVSKDLNGIVSSWNSGAERMFGYRAQEMIGKPITTIIPPELHADERRILETIARGERIEHFETARVTRTGERIEVSLTISPIKDETGKIVGAAKIARDITQQKKAERALHTSERLAAVGRLAATVAHEINNPLAAVMNLVYLSKSRAVGDDVRKFLTSAEEELKRISVLTRQTLGFYRDTHWKSTASLGGIVQDLVSVFAYKARNKGIEICSEIRQAPEIYAVAGEIRQVVANLLSNSIDAVGKNGKVRIRVSAAKRWKDTELGVRLTVADSGPGIPPEARSQLFEPFFTTKKEVGTGLGLWICKNVVEKHQGSIRLRTSTTPGRSWTVFNVFLPLRAKQPASEAGNEEGFSEETLQEAV